jgi:hypothetical protein
MSELTTAEERNWLVDFATIFAHMWYRDFPLQWSFRDKAQRADWTTHIAVSVRSTAVRNTQHANRDLTCHLLPLSSGGGERMAAQFNSGNVVKLRSGFPRRQFPWPAWTRFFGPLPAFLEAMQPFLGLEIVDVGTGRGHVAAALAAGGHTVTAIDIETDGTDYPVTLADAVTFAYPPGSVALLCRPCHSPFFTRPALERMIECDVRAVIYVGLRKNVSTDLGGRRRLFRRAATNVGVTDESFYLWDRGAALTIKQLLGRSQRSEATHVYRA